MIRRRLVSSMMTSVGYNPTCRVLEIEFTSGAVYQYVDVPIEVYRDLLDASSHGHFFSSHIRRSFTCHRATGVSAQ